MKKYLIYIGIATLLAGCEVDDPVSSPGTGGGLLRIDARVADAALEGPVESPVVKSAFGKGDQIVVIDDAGSPYLYKYCDDNWCADPNHLRLPGEGSFSLFAAHKPDGEVMSPTPGAFHIFVDELKAVATTAGNRPTILPDGEDYKAILNFTHVNTLLSLRNVKETVSDAPGAIITGVAFAVDTTGNGLTDVIVAIAPRGTVLTAVGDIINPIGINPAAVRDVIAPPGTILTVVASVKLPSGEIHTASTAIDAPIVGGLQYFVDCNLTPAGLTATVHGEDNTWNIRPPQDVELSTGFEQIRHE